MDMPTSIDALGALFAFVWPGVLSLQVYRLVMPARYFEWQNAVSQGLFYSVINYVLLFPLVLFVVDAGNADGHPISYWLSLIGLLLVGPAALPLIYKWAHSWKWLRARVQAPYPTAWDYFFAQRKPTFVLVHLKNGTMVGGYWGEGSYASAYPEEGDLYLSHSVSVNDHGKFKEVVAGTNGLLIRRDEFEYLEFLHSSAGSADPSKEKSDDGRQQSEAEQ